MKKLTLAVVLTVSAIALTVGGKNVFLSMFFEDPPCQLPFCDPDAPPSQGGGGTPSSMR